MRTTVRSAAATAVALTALIGFTGCGDDGTDVGAETTNPSTTETTAPADDHGDEHGEAVTLSIAGVDYGFEDVPDSVPAGSTISFTNRSAAELHEVVAFRLPDDVTTPIDELVKLPAEELEALLGAPVAVIVQPPGSTDQIVAVGDGTLQEPGRYALMCFIPIGADPGEYLAAAAESEGGPPQGVAGGPPHFTAGMFTELIVE